MKIEIDVEIPTGYRFLRYDYAKKGERFVAEMDGQSIWTSSKNSNAKFVIIEPEQQYREPSIPGEVSVDQGVTFEEDKLWFVGKTRAGYFVVENKAAIVHCYKLARSKVYKAFKDADCECPSTGRGICNHCLAEPEYRQVNWSDVGKEIEVTDDPSKGWEKEVLLELFAGVCRTKDGTWTRARVQVKPIYREATADDVGRQVEVSDSEDFPRQLSLGGTLKKVWAAMHEFKYELDDGTEISWRYCRIKS